MEDSGEKIKVLVVDDHTLVREGFVRMLELESEFSVVGQAGSADEAFQKVKELSPEIVLMDIKLQGTNGIEATRQIKKDFPDVEVIILSMYDEEEYVIESFKSGAIGYILKDSTKDELKRAIKAAYSGRSLIDPTVAKKLLSELDRTSKAATAAAHAPKPSIAKELSDREVEVLQHVAQGKSNKKIADELNISEKTVKAHLRSIFRKLEVADRAQAVAYAMRKGLVE